MTTEDDRQASSIVAGAAYKKVLADPSEEVVRNPIGTTSAATMFTTPMLQ